MKHNSEEQTLSTLILSLKTAKFCIFCS